MNFEEEPHVGNLVLAKCQAVSEAAGGIKKTLGWTLECHASEKANYIRGCKRAEQNKGSF